jgi:hypothetical protein
LGIVVSVIYASCGANVHIKTKIRGAADREYLSMAAGVKGH